MGSLGIRLIIFIQNKRTSPYSIETTSNTPVLILLTASREDAEHLGFPLEHLSTAPLALRMTELLNARLLAFWRFFSRSASVSSMWLKIQQGLSQNREEKHNSHRGSSSHSSYHNELEPKRGGTYFLAVPFPDFFPETPDWPSSASSSSSSLSSTIRGT